MASQAQIAANRRNALKSTGPKTAQGKEAVAQNAMRHGLCAERVVVLDESAEDYTAFSAGLHAALAPADEYETALAERIVQCEWRLRRVWRMEAAAIDEEAASQGRARARLVAADTLAAELRENHSAAAARKAAADVAAEMGDDELRAYADPAPRWRGLGRPALRPVALRGRARAPAPSRHARPRAPPRRAPRRRAARAQAPGRRTKRGAKIAAAAAAHRAARLRKD